MFSLTKVQTTTHFLSVVFFLFVFGGGSHKTLLLPPSVAYATKQTPD